MDCQVSATDARGVSTRYYLTYRLSTVFFQSLQHDYRRCPRTSCNRSFLTLTCWPYAYFHENWDSTATAYCPLNLWEVFVLYYLRKSQLNMAYQQKVFYMKESKLHLIALLLTEQHFTKELHCWSSNQGNKQFWHIRKDKLLCSPWLPRMQCQPRQTRHLEMLCIPLVHQSLPKMESVDNE